jgi:serine/threonine protein kinase
MAIQVFARKVIRSVPGTTDQKVMKREIEALVVLCQESHENIIELLGHQIRNDMQVIDFELCELSLREWFDCSVVRKQWWLTSPIDETDQKFFVVALMQQLLNGLYFIHAHGKVHRDLTPQNGTFNLSRREIINE